MVVMSPIIMKSSIINDTRSLRDKKTVNFEKDMEYNKPKPRKFVTNLHVNKCITLISK